MLIAGIITWYQAASLVFSILALTVHAYAISTNSMRISMLEDVVIRKDGLWYSCTIEPSDGESYVCEDPPESTVSELIKTARGAALVATGLIVAAIAFILYSLMKARMIQRHTRSLKLTAAMLVFFIIALITCTATYAVDTNTHRPNKAKGVIMTFDLGYTLELAAIGLGFMAFIMMGIHRRFQQKPRVNRTTISIINNNNMPRLPTMGMSMF